MAARIKGPATARGIRGSGSAVRVGQGQSQEPALNHAVSQCPQNPSDRLHPAIGVSVSKQLSMVPRWVMLSVSRGKASIFKHNGQQPKGMSPMTGGYMAMLMILALAFMAQVVAE
jgi:hypothetical protein